MNDKAQSRSPAATKDAVAKVHDVAEQARNAATERVELVRDEADSVKARAAERVRKLGGAVRKIGEHMRVEEQRAIAEQAQNASRTLDSVAAYLDDTELSDLIQDAETLARRSPAWVLGGTFLVGLAAGRLLKLPQAELGSAGRAAPLTATEDEPRSHTTDGNGSRVGGAGKIRVTP